MKNASHRLLRFTVIAVTALPVAAFAETAHTPKAIEASGLHAETAPVAPGLVSNDKLEQEQANPSDSVLQDSALGQPPELSPAAGSSDDITSMDYTNKMMNQKGLQ